MVRLGIYKESVGGGQPWWRFGSKMAGAILVNQRSSTSFLPDVDLRIEAAETRSDSKEQRRVRGKRGKSEEKKKTKHPDGGQGETRQGEGWRNGRDQGRGACSRPGMRLDSWLRLKRAV